MGRILKSELLKNTKERSMLIRGWGERERRDESLVKLPVSGEFILPVST